MFDQGNHSHPILPTPNIKRPKELDVPHWAIDGVCDVRNRLFVDSKVTDRMIFARLVALHEMPESVIDCGISSLTQEVLDWEESVRNYRPNPHPSGSVVR